MLPPGIFGANAMMKRMLSLKAIKPHLYGTRRLEAGDEYEAPVEEAIAQVAMRRADFIKGKKPTAPVPAAKPESPISIEPLETLTLDDLRRTAEQLGIDVDGRWGMARLQHEIHEAKRR
jgi:hypothetical protein